MTVRWRPAAVVAAVVFLAGSVLSTVEYARPWHDRYPARAFVQNAHDSLRFDPTSAIADVEVPNAVQSRLSFPRNLPSHLLAPYGDLVNAVTSGNDLHILDDDGVHRQAALLESTRAATGPRPQCGHRVRSGPVRIEVDRDEIDSFWWLSLGYLSSGDGRVSVSVDGRPPEEISVLGGLHTYYLRGEGAFSSLVLRAIDPDLTVCVDTVVIGEIAPVG